VPLPDQLVGEVGHHPLGPAVQLRRHTLDQGCHLGDPHSRSPPVRVTVDPPPPGATPDIPARSRRSGDTAAMFVPRPPPGAGHPPRRSRAAILGVALPNRGASPRRSRSGCASFRRRRPRLAGGLTVRGRGKGPCAGTLRSPAVPSPARPTPATIAARNGGATGPRSGDGVAAGDQAVVPHMAMDHRHRSRRLVASTVQGQLRREHGPRAPQPQASDGASEAPTSVAGAGAGSPPPARDPRA
jgi:hypothetical protein